ncbi:hypothetical protein [Actinomadura alba]|uniref:Uncharacterized protein n=1 Tax=Actinomadura alba TaxID=406431 RepID=A0ABR7LKY7_9ACTN|nr:hypothetical protein [Actinomadura alba]MBC6465501.1 hypothetical protein [Actinomadura alba]
MVYDAAVIAAAIEDAEGFRVDAMPISPDEIFRLRRRAAAGGAESLHRERRHAGRPAS